MKGSDKANWIQETGLIPPHQISHYVLLEPSEDWHEQHCLYSEQLAVSMEFRRAVCSMSLAHAEEWRKDQALVNSDADGSVWTILIPCEFLSVLLPKHH